MRYFIALILTFTLLLTACGGGSGTKPEVNGDTTTRETSMLGSWGWSQLGGDHFNSHVAGATPLDPALVAQSSYSLSQPVKSSIVFAAGDKCYVTTTDGDLHILDYTAGNPPSITEVDSYTPEQPAVTECYSTPAIHDFPNDASLYYEHGGWLYKVNLDSTGLIQDVGYDPARDPDPAWDDDDDPWYVGHVPGSSPSVSYYELIPWDAVYSGNGLKVSTWDDTRDPLPKPNPRNYSCYKAAYEPEGASGNLPQAITWDINSNTLVTWRLYLSHIEAESQQLPGIVPFMAHPLEITTLSLFAPGNVVLATSTDLILLEQLGTNFSPPGTWGIKADLPLPEGEEFVSSCAFVSNIVWEEPKILVVRRAEAEWIEPGPGGAGGGVGAPQMCGFVDCYKAVEVMPDRFEWQLQWYGIMDSASPSTPVSCSDGKVYAASQTGFYIFDENSTPPAGEPMRRMPSYCSLNLGSDITSSPQVAGDGSVWLGSDDGNVYVFYE